MVDLILSLPVATPGVLYAPQIPSHVGLHAQLLAQLADQTGLQVFARLSMSARQKGVRLPVGLNNEQVIVVSNYGAGKKMNSRHRGAHIDEPP
jgi:hypothetical protein